MSKPPEEQNLYPDDRKLSYEEACCMDMKNAQKNSKELGLLGADPTLLQLNMISAMTNIIAMQIARLCDVVSSFKDEEDDQAP